MEAARRLHLDASNTRVGFRVQWFGIVRVSGSFTGVHGDLVLPGDDHPDAFVELTVDSVSLHTGIPLRDRHLRGPRFLDGAGHPEIRFTGRARRMATGWTIHGRLAMRGRDRNLTLTVPDEKSRDGRQRLAAAFRIPRRDFGVGAATGIRRLNPLLWAIAGDVTVEVVLTVPAMLLQPTVAPARAR